VPIGPAHGTDPPPADPCPGRPTPAERLERSGVLSWIIAAMALVYLVRYVRQIGAERIDLNAINLLFLALGLLLHEHPRAYCEAIGRAAAGCSGIILQFPFYAGIMGMLTLSGLAARFAALISQTAGPDSLGPVTFLSAGVVNLFVPSGGGQWAIQGPLVVQTADTLGVPLGKAVMAFAYGDEWTNMLQPFWALPLLSITGLAAREIIGYTALLMLLTGPIYLLCLFVF
ncbi:MAG: TIGR00366 family protein, partial [Gammaproteobacteria bacterium]|nr:TIGR00366 family protein [Gammaproteobacteria bacterium]